MISLETARKLKDAGLPWEPQIGDWYSYESYLGPGKTENITTIVRPVSGLEWSHGFTDNKPPEDAIWLPRLDQLLTEIERRRYKWTMRKYNKGVSVEIRLELEDRGWGSETAEEGTAEAVLWLLGQEATPSV